LTLVRVWQVPAEQWLTGGLGTLPLAPLGDVQEAELPTVIARMRERLDREVPPEQVRVMWSATYILMGLRYSDALIDSLLQGVMAMEESVTYQKIIKKGEALGKALGKVEEARRLLLLQGRNRFGETSPEVQSALDALTDVNHLEELSVRLLHVASWQELLG
jgi:hypothetical protein